MHKTESPRPHAFANLTPRLRCTLISALASVLLLLALVPTPSVYAAEITVGSGGCTLPDAITAANSDSESGSCPAGSGDDTIVLNSDVSLSSDLPGIVSNIVLQGNGHTTDGGGNTLFVISAGAQVTLNQLTIRGGEDVTGGGIFCHSDSIVTVNNSTISSNTANLYGGGIMVHLCDLTINNSTIYGNEASAGGGIHKQAGTITINDSTISGNTAVVRGGGIYNAEADGAINLHRTIVAGNKSLETNPGFVLAEEVYSADPDLNPIIANDFNLLGESSNPNNQAFFGFSPCAGAGCSDIVATSDGDDPAPMSSILNVSPADNGGPTHTISLTDVSVAADVIPTTDEGCVPGTSVDQRGSARANGLAQGGDGCDIGAYELAVMGAQSPTAVELIALAVQAELARPSTWAVFIALAALLTGYLLGRQGGQS